ncbi:hypothetical protein [Marinomonas fungiae]|uniref:TadE-like protein n=1 Tax=Marinomonas fungiae TaxID=1137284 RepID=A0A0K6IHG0_9GAMM|nr:hypothetical protein [Marinomonas fungiae]CUB02752.1 hypothetical protein Ga0061065_10289 [Marinomonas fungiae]
MSLSWVKNGVKRRAFKRSSNRGVAALEFVMGFAAFWGMCLLWAEMSYVSYVSALGDVLISNASHYAKLNPNDLSDQNQANFNQDFQTIIRQQDSLWSALVTPEGFKTSIQFVQSYSDLATLNTICPTTKSGNQCGTAIGAPIAIYRINYEYQPIFSSFFGASADIFAREMIVIQEYQRG